MSPITRKNRYCAICENAIKKNQELKVDKKGYRVHLKCAVLKVISKEIINFKNKKRDVKVYT